jgi:release factor glutamine methyltransferase
MSITAGCTIAEVLAANWLVALEARILLGHVLGLTRVQLITRSERVLNAAEAQQLDTLFARRRAGEPIAYLTGEREFFGLSFIVTPTVLIPRPETELLVELALERLPKNGALLDLGTGSGIIPIAVAHSRPDARVSAVDISEGALDIARQNAARHAVQVTFHRSDWYAALPAQRFDVIAANPPSALTDHGDGLSALRSIIAGAPGFLLPGGWLLMEHGYDQAQAVRELLITAGKFTLPSIAGWPDLAGIERVTGAQFDA